MKTIPNSFKEDVNFISPQKALAQGRSNMDYKPVEQKLHKPGNPHKGPGTTRRMKGGY
ncbi:MAG: hypothetical protein MN733_01975 [Nitrososphaera sp.]|nr:hypothetical protein [Nitrososphaera sp.]